MRRSRVRYAAIPMALALFAASCGKDRDKSSDTSSTTTTAAPTTTEAAATTAAPVDTSSATTTAATDTTVPAETTVPAPPVPMFGDAPWPCGPGDGNNTDDGTEKGVTKTEIKIASGDDAGYPAAPGLNHEMTDTIKAFVKKCNELGGINGRQITLNYYDAGIFNVTTAMQAACDDGNFFLVGEGWAFDSNQEEIRLGCGLPAVPTYSVSAAFAHGKGVFDGVPNPSDELEAGPFAQMAKLFPDAVKSAGTLVGAFSATQESRDKALAAAPKFGWNFVSSTIEYNPAGEADWTPFVKQLQDAGVKIVFWSGTCLPSLQLFMQTAHANGYDVPVLTDANHYTAQCAAANTDGSMDNLYIRVAAIPFEEASANPPTQDLIDLVKGNGGDLAQLGVGAASSFLLWATAASECGDQLTRACTLDNLSKIHEWTGHGLHAKGDPGGNHPAPCNLLLKLDGTKYDRVTPEAPGTYDCDPSYVVPIHTAALDAAMLDANRISQQFAG